MSQQLRNSNDSLMARVKQLEGEVEQRRRGEEELRRQDRLRAETQPLIPFADKLLALQDERRELRSVDPRTDAALIAQITKEVDSLLAHHTAEGRARPGMRAELLASAEQLSSNVGHEVTLIGERFVTRNGRRQYWRTATFSMYEEPILVRWVIGPTGQIEGLGLGPLSQAPPIDPER